MTTGYLDNLELARRLAQNFSTERFVGLLRRIAPGFRRCEGSLDDFLEGLPFDRAEQLGRIELPEVKSVLVACVHVPKELTFRSSRRRQYDFAKRVLKAGNHNAGIFAFYDGAGRFRLSLVTVTYHGTRRRFSTFRRHTFFVDPELPNKTFLQQLRKADFSSMHGILETFSLEAVSDEFYKEFKPKFDAIAQGVLGTKDPALRQDFALLFVIRTIFLGFVQKKGWLGEDQRFLQNLWLEYKSWRAKEKAAGDRFYLDWLEPVFFEALSSPSGRKVAYGSAPFSERTQRILQNAPYLNGELFKRKRGIDDLGLYIPDHLIGDFFDFLFQYNFTVEENELYDEELELNPEFLGIIFERLTNMEQGAVYTPRVEVDLMCRLALVKWLSLNTSIDQEKLYRLFFEAIHEPLDGDRSVELSADEVRTLIERLNDVTVCDPAAGSGAFLVGMLQVLDRTLEDLYSREGAPRSEDTPFERKRNIIERSLYGAEVKRWAVWINQLRLWLTLFVDMPDDLRHSLVPLLPSLSLKVRTGDSLVQRIGNKVFPVHGYPHLPRRIKQRITQLRRKKRDFFYNRVPDAATLIGHEEIQLFRDILDAIIDEKRKRIRSLVEELRCLTSPDLYGDSPSEGRRRQEGKLRQSIERLEAEIKDLEEQKRNLRDERPFVWGIEFADVFFDRGGFDIVIGNPPYVRQEEIIDPSGRLSPKEYKDALMEMVRLDFPDYFAKSWAEVDRFRKDRKPSGRSDLYTYFYIRSLRLLNERGVHVFICSNAWLDVAYGAWLQEFFLRKAPLYMVVDNRARRSFTHVDINTIITVAGAPLREGEVPKDHVVRFVAFKKPFEQVINAGNFIAFESASKTVKCDDFRAFPISVGELLEEGLEPASGGYGRYVGDKWGGKYLRAPDIFFTILEKGKGKLVRLGEIAEVNEGHPTGANSFFFVPKEVAKNFQIETKYLLPALMKTRNKAFFKIEDKHIDHYLLSLPSDESWRKDNVHEYVKYGEKEVLPNSRTLRSKKKWWYVSVRAPADLIAPCGYGARVWCAVNKAKAVTSNSYAEIRPYSPQYLPSIFFTLNHPVGWLFLELVGRISLGGGMLKVDPIEYRKVYIAKVNQNSLVPFDRPVHDIFTECGIDPASDIPISEQEPNPLPDRKALDDIVFDALGLTEEERKEVYRAVCQLVWERISKARRK